MSLLHAKPDAGANQHRGKRNIVMEIEYLTYLEGAGSPPHGEGWYWHVNGFADVWGPFPTSTDAYNNFRGAIEGAP